jgi:hypothetical protein
LNLQEMFKLIPIPKKNTKKNKLWYLVPLLMNYTQQVCIKPLYTLIVPKETMFFSMWRSVQFNIQFASNWSFDFWSLDPYKKWP